MTPGEHLIVIGQPEDAIAARASGMSLRDTLLAFLPGPKTLFVYLFRQALDGTVAENVLKHDIGGLNIDACRIGTTKRVPGGISHTASLFFGVQRMTGLEGGHNPNLGRWPTNLLLVHGPGCKSAGTMTIRGAPKREGETRPGDHAMTPNGVGHRPNIGTTPVHRFANEDGLETILAWNCQPDCPVRLLDEMSGLLHDRGNVAPTIGGGGLFWKEGRAFPSDYGCTDAGGASRFFPQFETLAEALDWLTRLIGC